MIEMLKLYARYNIDTNHKIIELLSSLSEDELKRERNTYYKSINNLFNHLVKAEWYYVNAMLFITGGDHSKRGEEIHTFQRIEASFNEAAPIMQELNEKLVNFLNNATEDQLKLQRKNIKLYNGRIVDITAWEYVAQHISHQLHHKGQLSQILDEIGIDHEFGNIFPYVKDSVVNKESI